MKIILGNLFIFGFLWLLYYLNAFSLFSNKYMPWFSAVLVISVFILGFKIMGSPFDVNEKEEEYNEKENENYDDDNNTSTKRKMKDDIDE